MGKELTPERKLRVAEEHFGHWHERGRCFFLDFENAFAREDVKNAAFHLHQSVECLYKALLLVYTNYTPPRPLSGFHGQSDPGDSPRNGRNFPLRNKNQIISVETWDLFSEGPACQGRAGGAVLGGPGIVEQIGADPVLLQPAFHQEELVVRCNSKEVEVTGVVDEVGAVPGAQGRLEVDLPGQDGLGIGLLPGGGMVSRGCSTASLSICFLLLWMVVLRFNGDFGKLAETVLWFPP